MSVFRARLALVTMVLALGATAPARAQVILTPTGVTTTFATTGGAIGNTIDQSGLSTGYTNLVTNFDTYIAGNPTHNSLLPQNYFSGTGSTGNFDFALGGLYRIESLALWNDGPGSPAAIQGFTLLAADNAGFAGAVSLGSFTATPSGTFAAVNPQVFTFTETQASFIRLQVTSNNGGTATLLGEVAFETLGAVPEPSQLVLGGIGAIVIGFKAYRRRRATASVS